MWNLRSQWFSFWQNSKPPYFHFFRDSRCINSKQLVRHCERMGHFQEHSDFQCGTMIGCHLCNKSSHENFLLNSPRSTVNGLITKWRQLGITAAQLQSDRLHRIIERGQWMLRPIMSRGHQLSAGSIAMDLQTSCVLQISARTVHNELHEIGFHGLATAPRPYFNANCQMQ